AAGRSPWRSCAASRPPPPPGSGWARRWCSSPRARSREPSSGWGWWRRPAGWSWRTGPGRSCGRRCSSPPRWRSRPPRRPRSAPLAMVAPAALAVLAGVVTARLVRLWSGVRLRVARRRGRVPALLSAAHLSRRPGSRRVVAVVTVSVALLAFAATAFDVAAQARRDHAVDTVGADRVYRVEAEHPTALLEAVRAVDPDG